jgi:glycosyltransferase involved in cell wall biosynthesis
LKVSALIPNYNRRAEVMQAIDSVLAQTVPVDEIIVVDDGSTDGSAEAVRSRYGPQVTVLQQKNAGVSAARNYGIREAHGDWIALLDSDDLWLPTKMERQFEALAALGDGFGLCFTDNIFTGNPEIKQSRFGETGFECASRFGSLDEPAEYILAEREPFFTSSIMARRTLLSEIGGFDPGMVVREDTDVMFRLSFKTKFCFASESLVEIDRDPFREIGLCNLFALRDERVYLSLQRMWAKWLVLPEVSGTKYEGRVKEKLRAIYYDSAESKIHEFRFQAAFRELHRLRAMGEGYGSISRNLVARKVLKLRGKRAQAREKTAVTMKAAESRYDVR